MKKKLLLGLLACSILGVMSVSADEVKCTCNKADCPCKCGCHTETMQIRTELFQKDTEEKTVEPVKTELLNIQPVNEEKVIEFEDTLSKAKEEVKTEEIKAEEPKAEEKTAEEVKEEVKEETEVIKSELQDKEIKNMEYVNGIIKDHMSEPLKQRIEQARKAAEEETGAVQNNIQEKVDEVQATVEEKINSVNETVVTPAEEKVETSVEMLKDKVDEVKSESFLDLKDESQTKTEETTKGKGLFGKKK